MDFIVSVNVKIVEFSTLLHRIAALPKPFRPTYFTVGERVRNKEASRIADIDRFSAFVDDHVQRVSGCDLIGDKIRYGIFVGATRNSEHESTHVGCSVILRGSRWRSADFELLLRLLCGITGVEQGDACLRDEWTHRHVCTKELDHSSIVSIKTLLGADISARLPGLYWWTVFSDELARRHGLDLEKLASFAGFSECWKTEAGESLHAFRLYESPERWRGQDRLVSNFLEQHQNFFSMTRIQPIIDKTQTKEEFDAVVKPYRTGVVPWETKKSLPSDIN